jgi:hypothetical protein
MLNKESERKAQMTGQCGESHFYVSANAADVGFWRFWQWETAPAILQNKYSEID